VRTARAAGRALLLVAGLFVFVLALELLKKGAAGIAPILRGLDVTGVTGGLGFGWLMACLVLSGSPVAAIALALLASGTLDTREAFAMIVGSRLGASFVVLVVGALDDLRARRPEKRSASIGVAALVATAVVYLPAMALAYAGLQAGMLRGLSIEGRELGWLLSRLYGPLTGAAESLLPRQLLFVLGVLVLLGAFRLFDLLLPDLHGRETPLARVGDVVYRPWFVFALGLGVTALTLSVSVSLSLLVPLAAKGYIRRENVCPYILGANITTFIDTLLAGALIGHPDAVRIVALLMGSVTALSLPVVLLFPYAFAQLVDGIARRATRDTRSLAAFVALLLLIPALLIAL
jgi:solute carrier family 34 (sodium-dependent phosphate cotransporter)